MPKALQKSVSNGKKFFVEDEHNGRTFGPASKATILSQAAARAIVAEYKSITGNKLTVVDPPARALAREARIAEKAAAKAAKATLKLRRRTTA